MKSGAVQPQLTRCQCRSKGFPRPSSQMLMTTLKTLSHSRKRGQQNTLKDQSKRAAKRNIGRYLQPGAHSIFPLFPFLYFSFLRQFRCCGVYEKANFSLFLVLGIIHLMRRSPTLDHLLRAITRSRPRTPPSTSSWPSPRRSETTGCPPPMTAGQGTSAGRDIIERRWRSLCRRLTT